MKTESSNSQAVITSLDDMPVVLSVCNIQKIMGISRKKAYELVNSEGFPHMKIGKRIAIPKSAFEQWLINSVENLGEQG